MNSAIECPECTSSAGRKLSMVVDEGTTVRREQREGGTSTVVMQTRLAAIHDPGEAPKWYLPWLVLATGTLMAAFGVMQAFRGPLFPGVALVALGALTFWFRFYALPGLSHQQHKDYRRRLRAYREDYICTVCEKTFPDPHKVRLKAPRTA